MTGSQSIPTIVTRKNLEIREKVNLLSADAATLCESMEGLLIGISKELIRAEEMRIEIKRIDVSTRYKQEIKYERVDVNYEVFLCKNCEEIGKICCEKCTCNNGSDICTKINY